MSKKKEEKPKIIRYFDINELEKLLEEIENFMSSFEERHCDRKSILINIYDNGKIELEGVFFILEKKEIML